MRISSALLLMLLFGAGRGEAWNRGSSSSARVTIIYDSFGERSDLTQDWGFAALIEAGGKRILFDTGNNAAIFERNVKALHLDLRRLDFAVISHRHGDHTSGLSYLLRVNPGITIYAPREGFGVFGAGLPGTFYRRESLLPERMRYFHGDPPPQLRFGTPWPEAHFLLVDSLTEVAPGVTLLSNVSQNPGTLELRELSLAIQTPEGLLLVVGCSHPGIEKIVESSRPLGDRVRMIVGGLHLVFTADPEIERVALALRDSLGVRQVAPGHCTGEPAFAALQRVFGDRYLYAGLGTVLEVKPPE